LKWPNALKCRWKKTIEEPFDFDITINVERKLIDDLKNGNGPLSDWWERVKGTYKNIENDLKRLKDV